MAGGAADAQGAPRAFARQARALSAGLLAGAGDPHDEWLTLLWGPRFDRAHALALWSRRAHAQPESAAPLWRSLMQMADAFDGLGRPMQHRLRHLILRHRALGAGRAGLPE